MKSKKKRSGNRETRKLARDEEIESLTSRVAAEAPTKGSIPPRDQRVAFRALAISQLTLRGLEDAKTPFTTMTDIQNACIPHALAGRDILGAARTGSGKTLAFLVPALECLYRNRFSPMDGPGVVVMSPTRELAVQIFQVLRAAGNYHTFSVGLLIGGQKDFYQEQQQVGKTNIIIATPGRLLQHLEQTPNFDISELRMLILDEADRILDMGFRTQLVRILEYLPSENRQTLLFSATQTRDVKNLATLSLRKPEYLGVHDNEKSATPEALQQSYIVVPLEHKLDAVYSFIKSHLKSKSIIFFATCAQVRYAWELFCSLRPGVPVMALHGKLVQAKRTEIYFDFVRRPHAVLFATDIAARGLDFKDVDWVVQADAPEDKDMYIHRAGRTARYRAGGKALLMTTIQEEKRGLIKMIEQKGKRVELKKLSINPTKTVVVTARAAAAVAANPKLNGLAKKAYESYIRSIYLMPDKDIFNVNDMELDGYAKSLGLAMAPNLRFLKSAAKDRDELRSTKNVNRKLQKLKAQIKAEKLQKTLEKMGKTNTTSETDPQEDIGQEFDDLLVPKKRTEVNEGTSDSDVESHLETAAHAAPLGKRKRIHIDSSFSANKHTVFGDDGEETERTISNITTTSFEAEKQDLPKASDQYMKIVRSRLKATMDQDDAEEKERVRALHKKRRMQEREQDAPNQQDKILTLAEGIEHLDDATDAETENDDVSEDGGDVSGQEKKALAFIRGK